MPPTPTQPQSSSRPTRAQQQRRRATSPFRRQQLLAERLSSTRRRRRQLRRQQQQQQQQLADLKMTTKRESTAAAAVVGNKSGGESIAGKRSLVPSVVASGPQPPARFPPSEVQSAACDVDVNDEDREANAIIGEFETWREASAILPLLSYGEESDALLSELLDFPEGGEDDADDARRRRNRRGTEGCDACDGDDDHHRAVQRRRRRRRRRILSDFARALDRMLRARTAMRRRPCGGVASDGGSEFDGASPPPKKRRSVEGRAPNATGSGISNETLSWHVLLRITVRMASYVARRLRRCCDCFDGSSDSSGGVKAEQEDATISEQEETAGDHDEKSGSRSTAHPILRVLDVVLADLHVLSRMRNQQRPRVERRTENDSAFNVTGVGSSTPAKPGASTPSPMTLATRGASPSSKLPTPRKSYLPRDRMVEDWKSNNQRHASLEREVWGPSRYAFLKDIESATSAMMSGAEDRADAGIDDAAEWHERVDSVVGALDEFVRAELGESPSRRSDVGRRSTLAMSPSSRGYGAVGPRETGSLASVARKHVDRARSRTKAGGRSPLGSGGPPSDAWVKGTNLGSTMDKERNALKSGGRSRLGELLSVPYEPRSDTGVAFANLDLPIPSGEERTGLPEMDYIADELGDAYRLAMLFGSSSEGENKFVRETIERRLNLLVEKLKAENHGIKSDGFNIDGAQSYLDSLLSTLMKPPDPSAWLRLMEESHGKETPIMLRRGRVLLASYLIGIKAPGWKDCDNSLESSPVPSYLGFLSANEDIQNSKTTAIEKYAMDHRSSYFLPAAEMGETTMPPAPIVTEVGLSLCVKKFLHKDTPDGNTRIHQQSGRSKAINLFRNYGPLQFQRNSSSEEDVLMSSIAASLPDVNELTRDLFDLTLRLAADDDNQHENKPFPLRLVTPSASESLNIILQVASDHLDWLSPHAIYSRYRFILQHTIQTFQFFGENVIETPGEGDFTSWSRRTAFLIGVTKTANRGRMALYATQFMTLLCSGRRKDAHMALPVVKQPHFYACLELRQPSRFWNDLDKTANDLSSNIMARVLDLNFCARFLLPLSYQSALLLASSYPPLHEEAISTHSQGSQSALSLVTILCSVLDLLADNGFLYDCIHIGWSIQMLLFSISHFVLGEEYNWREREFRTLSACDASSDSMWECMACQLNRLYCNVWGRQSQKIQESAATEKIISYESIQNDGARMVVLMPSFCVFVSSLIKFACNFHSSTDLNGIMSFCQLIAKKVLDCYAKGIQPPPSPRNMCDTNDYLHQNGVYLVSSWMKFLVLNLQEMVCCQRTSIEEHAKNEGETEEKVSTDKILSGLVNPMLKNLHWRIMQRTLDSGATGFQNMSDSPMCAASVFLHLYKYEARKFLNKPSPTKTRRWSIYRTCLEKVFHLTPPSTLFAFSGHLGLSDYSANVLEGIWNQYGQCNSSYSVSIMVAAGLHVNASATCLTTNMLLTRHDSSSLLKQLYSTFSSCAKSCIINTFKCFNNAEESKISRKESMTNFNHLVRQVRRELSIQRKAEVGLAWWNEILGDLFSLLEKTKERDGHAASQKSASVRGIAKAFSNLQNNLSAISGSK